MRGRLHRSTMGRTAPVVCIQKASARGPDVDRARVCSGPSQLIAPPTYGLRSCELAFVANTAAVPGPRRSGRKLRSRQDSQAARRRTAPEDRSSDGDLLRP